MELQRVWQRLFSFFFQSHCESVVPDNYVKQTRRWHSGLICFFVFFPDEQIDRKLRERWDLAAAVSLLASSDASAAAMSRGWEEGGGKEEESERERENIINRMWWCQTGSERWQRFAERRETMCRAAIQLSAVKTTRHQEVFRPRWRKTSAVLRTSPRFKKPAFISTTASNKCFYILSTEALNFNVYDLDKYEVIIVKKAFC